MIYLLIVSVLWAFSFGIIKGNLTGLDSNFVAFVRLFIPFIIFVPFLKISGLKNKIKISLIFNGGIQFGLMYIFYIYSFQFLKAYEIAVFTILTPLYVTLINDIFQNKFNKLFFTTSVLSIIGAGVIVFQNLDRTNFLLGFIILQLSNLCFAFGQIYYKRIMNHTESASDKNVFGLLYLGAMIITFVFSMFTTDYTNLEINNTQVLSLLYLGAAASGIGFFLWNYGARRTDAGALAIFNNLKIPLGVAASVFLFGEDGNLLKLLFGFLIICAALIINEKYKSALN
ncbi:MAG: EamA family transporter [Bacteroidetes bacterium]|nr:EamA family transporter [Bacteroidota bacterium]